MFDKFLFGNKQIPEMYFGYIPVVQIYFGNTLVWEKTGYVPYDNTCTATVTLSQDKTAWIVTITKDGDDVTSSLSQITTWIYDGKGERVRPYTVDTNIIDLSQKPRGDYRVDLAQITSKAGGYFPGKGSISVPEHIYIGTLLAGSQNVAIEYVPTEDITVNSIEIFTSQTDSSQSNSGRIKILHESGLYVGAFDGNGEDASTERYHLTGRPRTVSNVGVTLYAGEKYYLLFHDGNTSLYYPAYFQNENGNYIANFTDNAQASTLHPYQNITAIKDYLPAGGGAIQEADLQSILELDTNELFLWNGNNLVVNQTVIINDDHLGKKLTEKVTNPQITTSDADIWSYTNQQIFVRHGYGSDVVNRIWKKTETTKYDGTITLTKQDGIGQFIEILLALEDSTQSKVLTNHTDYQFQNDENKLFTLKSGYSADSTLSFTALNYIPSGAEKHFYYIEGGYDIWGDWNHQTALYVYENGTYTAIYSHSEALFKSYLIMTSLDSKIEQVSLTTLVQEDQQVSCNSSVKSATISSDKKFYLKINGKEV